MAHADMRDLVAGRQVGDDQQSLAIGVDVLVAGWRRARAGVSTGGSSTGASATGSGSGADAARAARLRRGFGAVGVAGSAPASGARTSRAPSACSAGRTRSGDSSAPTTWPMASISFCPCAPMSVYENMAFALKLRKTPKPEIDRRVKEAAALLQLDEELTRVRLQSAQLVELGGPAVRDHAAVTHHRGRLGVETLRDVALHRAGDGPGGALERTVDHRSCRPRARGRRCRRNRVCRRFGAWGRAAGRQLWFQRRSQLCA